MLSGDRDQAFRYLCHGCLLACLWLPLAAGAQPPPPGPPGLGEEAAPPPPAPLADPAADRWLEAVRAQRQAWEERRRASQEALDARRRQHDTHQDARQLEHLRRREALREQIERDREHFFNQGPWQAPPPDAISAHPGHTAGPEAPPPGTTGGEAPLAYPPLPGWNNRWYYQGY